MLGAYRAGRAYAVLGIHRDPPQRHPHRQAALDATSFLIDWLKTKAPFWKLEDTDKGAQWVTAEARDDKAAARWIKR